MFHRIGGKIKIVITLYSIFKFLQYEMVKYWVKRCTLKLPGPISYIFMSMDVT